MCIYNSFFFNSFRLGETCSHIAAMLFKLEAAVRLGYTSSSCTSEACQWNATFLKNVNTAPISGIVFYKDNYSSKSATKEKKTVNAPSQVELDNFLLALKTVSPKYVLLSAFDEHCDNFIDKTPQVTEDAYPVDLGTLNQTQQVTKLVTVVKIF